MDDHPCGLQNILKMCACGCKYLQGNVSDNFICVLTALGLQPVQQHVCLGRCTPSFMADTPHRRIGSILYLQCLGDSSLLLCDALFLRKRNVMKDLSAFSKAVQSCSVYIYLYIHTVMNTTMCIYRYIHNTALYYWPNTKRMPHLKTLFTAHSISFIRTALLVHDTLQQCCSDGMRDTLLQL